MSEKSWREEFYPTDAKEFFKKRRTKKNIVAAVEHSLRKWKGAEAGALKRHELDWVPIDFNLKDCSLCQMFVKADEECSKCPLAKVRGGKTCCAAEVDSNGRKKEKHPPYDYFIITGKPRRMILALRRALRYAKGELDAKKTGGSKT